MSDERYPYLPWFTEESNFRRRVLLSYFEKFEGGKMSDNHYWPCDHIDREGHAVAGLKENIMETVTYGPWIYGCGKNVPSRWIACPDCLSRRPKPPSKIEKCLWEIRVQANYGRYRTEVDIRLFYLNIIDLLDRYERGKA